MALAVGKQAQMIAIWHSIVDQWLRDSISSAEWSVIQRGWTPKKGILTGWVARRVITGEDNYTDYAHSCQPISIIC